MSSDGGFGFRARQDVDFVSFSEKHQSFFRPLWQRFWVYFFCSFLQQNFLDYLFPLMSSSGSMQSGNFYGLGNNLYRSSSSSFMGTVPSFSNYNSASYGSSLLVCFFGYCIAVSGRKKKLIFESAAACFTSKRFCDPYRFKWLRSSLMSRSLVACCLLSAV